MVRLLVGCYTKGHEPLFYYTNHAEQGAYVVELNSSNGNLSVVDGPVDAGINPTYAAFDPTTSTAYFTNEYLEKGCVKAFRLGSDSKLTPMNQQPVAGSHPCWLAMSADNQRVLCANYMSGDVTVFSTTADGSLNEGVTTALPADGPYPGPVAARQDKAHAHCYAPLGTSGFGIVGDLGTDQVVSLRIADNSVVGRSKFPPGSGPRHAAVSADAKWVYISTELSSTIAAVPADPVTGSLGPVAATISLQPAGYSGPPTTASHIELSTCGRFAFVANRVGVDIDGGAGSPAEGTVSVIKLSPEKPEEHLLLVEHKSIGGKVPRSCAVAGNFLVVVAQESSLLLSFAIGPNGHLTAAHSMEIPSPGVVVALPEVLEVCDSHMHCWDKLEKVSKFNNHILGDCGTYLPEDYRKDLRPPPFTGIAVNLRSCVHVEAFPTDQVQETRWIASLKNGQFPLCAIVANANISLQKENEKSTSMQAEGMEALEDVLARHKETSGLVRGIRWVLNHEPNWPQVHRGDYFTDPQFRAGYKKLEDHGLSYDLQCNPHQLKDAAGFLKDFPGVPVALNHVGSLKLEGDLAKDKDWLKSAAGQTWQGGMEALAALPHVYCKLSMLAYTVPSWWTSVEGKEIAKSVVLETIRMFGPERCMFASNFPAEDAPCRAELYGNFRWMVRDMDRQVQEGLFFRNAERFYKIDPEAPHAKRVCTK